MSEFLASILSLILPVSVGGIGGFFLGYAFKKVYRFAMALGIFILSVAYLAYNHIINLNTSEIETVSTFIGGFAPFIITPLTSSLLLMGGLAIGLISGLKKGWISRCEFGKGVSPPRIDVTVDF